MRATTPRAAGLLLAATLSAAPELAGGRRHDERTSVRRVRAGEAEVVLRPSDDGDPRSWEGILEAIHRGTGGAVAYVVQVRLGGPDGGAETLRLRVLEYRPPLASRCPARRLRPPGRRRPSPPGNEAEAFYHCAFRRCLARAGECAGAGAEAAACLAARCRHALLACLHAELGCP